MSVEEVFKKHLEHLTDDDVDRGCISFSYLQGKHTIDVTIASKADYGKK